jgi:hypothetical protein
VVTTKSLSPTDLLAAIFAELPDELCKDVIPTKTPWIHRTFFNLKNAYPDLLGSIPFDETDMFPYSPVIDEAIANLQIREDLQRKNPKLTTFDVNPETKGYLLRTNKLKLEQKSEVKKISHRLAEEIKKTQEKVPS